MIKNILLSSGQTVTLATGQTYDLKDNEVMINGNLYRKSDLEISVNGNSANSNINAVFLGIRKRDGRRNLPADLVLYNEWSIDGVQQASLADALENIQTAIYYDPSNGGGGGSSTWGSITGDINNQTDLINLINAINAGYPVENEYVDINDVDPLLGLIAGQGNQTNQYFQYVADASADPNVTENVGAPNPFEAYYQYLGTTNGNLTDYRLLSDTEVQTILDSNGYRVFRIQAIQDDSAPVSTANGGRISFNYNNVTDKVTSVVFNQQYSSIIQRFYDYRNIVSYKLKFYNRNTQQYEFAKITEWTQNGNYFIVDVENTIDRNELGVNNRIELFFEIDNEGNSIFSSEEYSIFDTDLTKVKTSHSETYLVTPTYDGSNEALHPSVLYFKNGWNGYKYWMANTPYPNYDSTLENPSILVSNDNITWIVPVGGSNPIVPYPGGADYNSDTELVYDPVNDKIWMYYRTRISGTSEEQINVVGTTDGINWSAPVTVLSSIATTWLVSPTVLYIDGQFVMWFMDADDPSLTNRKISKLTSANADSGWNLGSKTVCTIHTALPDNRDLWHLAMNYTNGEYHLWLCTTGIGGNYGGELMFGKSPDGENFYLTEGFILDPYDTNGWDGLYLYRATAVYLQDKAKYGMWYSADSGSEWHIGYTEVDLDYDGDSDLIDKPSVELGNAIDLTNININYYNLAVPLDDLTYTISNSKLGGKAVVKFNSPTEPTFTGCQKLRGMSDTFVADTDMYAFIEFNGFQIEYYIKELDILPFVIPDISTSSLVGGGTFSTLGQGGNPYNNIHFSNDNSKLYLGLGSTIFQYNVILGTPNTYIYSGKSFTTGASPIYWMTFSDENDLVTCSSAFSDSKYTYTFTDGDIDTCVLLETNTFGSFRFNDAQYVKGGTEIHCWKSQGTNLGEIVVIPLSTPYLLSTKGVESYVPITEIADGSALRYSNDGTKLYLIADVTSSPVYQYTCATPHTPSTATYDTDTFSQGTISAWGIAFMKGTMRKWISANNNNDQLREYTW